MSEILSSYIRQWSQLVIIQFGIETWGSRTLIDIYNSILEFGTFKQSWMLSGRK